MTDDDSGEFRKRYSQLSDEELLSLAQDDQSLTPVAMRELEGELRRRNIGQARRDEFRAEQGISQVREERSRKRAALRRRRWIEDWFTSRPILVGVLSGGLAWYVARKIFSVPHSSARLLAAGVGFAAIIISTVAGILILDARRRWRKLKSHGADKKSSNSGKC